MEKALCGFSLQPKLGYTGDTAAEVHPAALTAGLISSQIYGLWLPPHKHLGTCAGTPYASHTDVMACMRCKHLSSQAKEQCVPLNQKLKEKHPLEMEKARKWLQNPQILRCMLQLTLYPYCAINLLSAFIYLSRLPASRSKDNALDISK